MTLSLRRQSYLLADHHIGHTSSSGILFRNCRSELGLAFRLSTRLQGKQTSCVVRRILSLPRGYEFSEAPFGSPGGYPPSNRNLGQGATQHRRKPAYHQSVVADSR